jgi:hypothetical protein
LGCSDQLSSQLFHLLPPERTQPQPLLGPSRLLSLLEMGD